MAVWAGVVFFASLSVVAGDCTPGKYGYRCSYQCHCPLVNCNPTSGCEPAHCSEGWSGPTCQKENIALNKTTSSSSVHFPSSNAVNGDTRGRDTRGGGEHRCFHSVYYDASITSAWWRVDLGKETLVRDVVIYFRTNYIVRRNGIQIYIADTDNCSTDGVHCYTVTGNKNGTDIPDVLNVTCSDEGRFLVLYTTTVNNEIYNVNVPVLDFCEVKVEVCGPGTFGADCDNYCHCDGEVCNYVSGVCPSGDCLPGWQPDKCDTACVQDVEYGAGCVGNCSARMCEGGIAICPRDTGQCESGCQSGWKGKDCTQACIQGLQYGAGCLDNCTTRMCEGGTGTCPRDTGRCESGCQPGWKGEDCTSACVQGDEYGAGCKGSCRARKCLGESGSCPRDTGRCEDGCQSGWEGEDCAKVAGLVNENSVARTDPPFSHIIGVVFGLVVGVVLTLLLTGGVHLYLFRKGRLLWSRDPVKNGKGKETPDSSMTLADNYTSISELPRTDGRNTQDKDYGGLDTETRADNKHYDVIQNKVYENA